MTSICPASNGEQAIARPHSYATMGKRAEPYGVVTLLVRLLYTEKFTDFLVHFKKSLMCRLFVFACCCEPTFRVLSIASHVCVV